MTFVNVQFYVLLEEISLCRCFTNIISPFFNLEFTAQIIIRVFILETTWINAIFFYLRKLSVNRSMIFTLKYQLVRIHMFLENKDTKDVFIEYKGVKLSTNLALKSTKILSL